MFEYTHRFERRSLRLRKRSAAQRCQRIFCYKLTTSHRCFGTNARQRSKVLQSGLRFDNGGELRIIALPVEGIISNQTVFAARQLVVNIPADSVGGEAGAPYTHFVY